MVARLQNTKHKPTHTHMYEFDMTNHDSQCGVVQAWVGGSFAGSFENEDTNKNGRILNGLEKSESFGNAWNSKLLKQCKEFAPGGARMVFTFHFISTAYYVHCNERNTVHGFGI